MGGSGKCGRYKRTRTAAIVGDEEKSVSLKEKAVVRFRERRQLYSDRNWGRNKG